MRVGCFIPHSLTEKDTKKALEMQNNRLLPSGMVVIFDQSYDAPVHRLLQKSHPTRRGLFFVHSHLTLHEHPPPACSLRRFVHGVRVYDPVCDWSGDAASTSSPHGGLL